MNLIELHGVTVGYRRAALLPPIDLALQAGAFLGVVGPNGSSTLLGETEAWLASDAPDASVDSRRYGPVDAEHLLGRVAWRYGPPRRFGRIR